MVHQSFTEYYQSLLDSGELSNDELYRLFPHRFPHRELHQLLPILEGKWDLGTPIPAAVCQGVAEFCGFRYFLNTQAPHGCCESIVTETICKSHGCNWNCVCCARSRQPLEPMKFFKIHCTGNQVGIGFTLNPCGRTGLRFNQESAGFYLDAKTFFFGRNEEDPNRSECKLSITNLISRNTTYKHNSNVMALAIDYDNNKVLLQWPNRAGTMTFDLPPHFRNCLLFPLVQSWNGCKATLHDGEEAENQNDDDDDDDEDDDSYGDYQCDDDDDEGDDSYGDY